MATIRLETMPGAGVFVGRYDIYLDDQQIDVPKRQKLNVLSVDAGLHTMHVKVGPNSSRWVSFGIGLSSGSRTARMIGVALGGALTIVGIMMFGGPGISFGLPLLLFVFTIIVFVYNYFTGQVLHNHGIRDCR